jgi:hypothetical protein
VSVKHCRDLRDFAAQVSQDTKAREARVRTAVRKTARETRNYVARETIPVAFGELREALYVQDAVNGSAVVCDAPHAAAVENGSRPHTPPIEPLSAWVTLRGVQGLTKRGTVKSNRTRNGRVVDWRRAAAKRIATELANRMGGRTSQWRAQAASHLAQGNRAAMAADPDVVAVARAIQMAITKRGTKPQPYMQPAIPEAARYLDEFVTAALPDK